MKDSASFWTDIKELEERLAKAPDSFCFAKLSDVYLKMGLIDDALHVARQGVSKYPRYLSGQRALALACHAKGLDHEALAALQLITAGLPEDVPSQKLLGRLCAGAGDLNAARQAFRTALEFEPDDPECLIELEALERSAGAMESVPVPNEYDDMVIEDLEILEELEILEDDHSEAEFQFPEPPIAADSTVATNPDPLSTGTLAELYVKQGFIHKALEIYRAILADNPADNVVAARVVELETLENGPTEPESDIDDIFGVELEDNPEVSVSGEISFHEVGPETVPGDTPLLLHEDLQTGKDAFNYERSDSPVPQQGVADNALFVFNGWLENIRRIKSCR